MELTAFRYFVGWDVSKLTLNYCLLDAQEQRLGEGQIDNCIQAVEQLLTQLCADYQAESGAFLHCMEQTGHYGNRLLTVSRRQELSMWVEDGLQLKLSQGRRKDKNDQVDARYIARYCIRNQADAKLDQGVSTLKVQIREFSAIRLKLTSQRQSLKTSLQERRQFSLVEMDPVLIQILETQIEQIEQQLDKISKRILELIKADRVAARKLQIARSVPGIGPKNVIAILAITELFERILTAKQCASYAGVSPHQKVSGTSIRSSHRVSKASNKELKKALHQGAQFLIARPSLFKDLYDRLRKKGRTYRQAINAVRNKMIRVLYACLKKDVMYDKKMHQSFA